MFSTIRKEIKLMFRDPIGLLLLIIMPAILIMVMTLVQDGPFQDLHDVTFKVMVLNKDEGNAGEKILRSIDSSKNFDTISATTEEELRTKVRAGQYKIGIIIPQDATKTLINTSNKIVNKVSLSNGTPALFQNNDRLDSTHIEIIYDPTLKPAFKSAFRFALIQYVSLTKMNFLLNRLNKMSGDEVSAASTLSASVFDVLSVEEASQDKSQISEGLNSVQHNVPAWAIFGMFLIVVPISGNMIREREEGSAIRLRLIPGAYVQSTVGIIVFYTFFCIFQFYCMILIGKYLVPLMGLPSLSFGSHPWAVLPLVIAIAFSATSYGYFLGTVFKTANQSMPVGAISIVILSALGGIWVPLEILPPLMTTIARFTPLYWAISGINNVFLRGMDVSSVIVPTVIMLLSGIVLTGMSIYIAHKKLN